MPNPHLPEPSPPGPPSLLTDEELKKNSQLGDERFRVLVIGDAGVGKKTIIQKVHKAAIFRPDGMGNKVCIMFLEGYEFALEFRPTDHNVQQMWVPIWHCSDVRYICCVP